MATTLSISEQLTYSTVRIECQLRTGGVSTGTGFFYRFAQARDQHIPAIVTTKRVVEGAARGTLRLHLMDNAGKPRPATYDTFTIDDFHARWLPHPRLAVDLCAMPIAPILNQATANGRPIFYVSLDKALIPQPDEVAELAALEDIVVMGYPDGIWDSVNNLPIIRRGITATHPRVDYKGRQEFLIDMAGPPGSSGSPVFLLDAGGYPGRSGGVGPGSRVKLLGVLAAEPQNTAPGVIAMGNLPTRRRPEVLPGMPDNLGVVIKAQRLLEFDPVLAITDVPAAHTG